MKNIKLENDLIIKLEGVISRIVIYYIRYTKLVNFVMAVVKKENKI